MTTIVIGWLSRRQNGVPYWDGYFAQAAVWLFDGNYWDLPQAEKYAETERAKNDGTKEHTVFTFEDEAHPLDRARALMLKTDK